MKIVDNINGKPPVGNVLVVNTGSITTKFGYYVDGEVVLDRKLEHTVEELSQFKDVMEQDKMRTKAILDALVSFLEAPTSPASGRPDREVQTDGGFRLL